MNAPFTYDENLPEALVEAIQANIRASIEALTTARK